MADFLTRLAERTLGLSQTVQPIIEPVFAPELAHDTDYQLALDWEDRTLGESDLSQPIHEDLTDNSRGYRPTPMPQGHETPQIPARPQHGAPGLEPAQRQRDGPYQESDELEPLRGKIPRATSDTIYSHNKYPDDIHSIGQIIDDGAKPEPGTGPRSGSTQNAHGHSERRASGQLKPVIRDAPFEWLHTAKKQELSEAATDQKAIASPEPMGFFSRYRRVKDEPPSSTATIRVTIGRIEVRAVMSNEPRAPPISPRKAERILSLDDYLKQRNGGGR